MINFTKRIKYPDPELKANDQLVLPFDLRQKSRLRVKLASGREAALLLDRGTILRGGDWLQAENGELIQIVASNQKVTDVYAHTPQGLTRAAYHLGNRHIPLQVGDGWVRFEQDHVLNDMLVKQGLTTRNLLAPFEPEAGAYGDQGHHHNHNNNQHSPIAKPMPNG